MLTAELQTLRLLACRRDAKGQVAVANAGDTEVAKELGRLLGAVGIDARRHTEAAALAAAGNLIAARAAASCERVLVERGSLSETQLCLLEEINAAFAGD